MKAKSSLHRYLAIITGGGWKPLVSVFALGLFSVSGAFGATYKLVNLGTAQSPVEFSDPSNWTVDGVSATTYPQSGDTILFGTASTKHHAYLALDKDYTISGITQKFNIPRLYRSSSAAADTVSLTFTGTVGGEGYQHYYVNNNTKMVFAQTSTLNCATGDANPSEAYVQGGGEIDVLGAVNSRHIKWVVRGGGKLYFAPTSYKLTSDTTSINDVFDIGNSASSIVFPNGLTVTGGNSSWRNEFKHNYGTVTFGGPFTSNSPWTYEWKAGVIAATADVTFGDTISLKIPDPNPNERNITVDAAAGASFTFPASTYFGTTVNLTKTGEGDVRFAGSTLPTTTAVNEGGFALCKNDATYDLSAVTFAAGTKLKIGASGITLSTPDASIANATFAALDGYIPANGATILTCADSTVLAQAQAGLNASLASVGISVEIDGNSLVAESHYTFNSSTVSNMNDATGWVNNLAAPAGQPVIIAGSQTAAVMDGAVPVYSAIGVTDGATLTVAATRDLPATTLAAGTSLHVAAASGSVQATVTATGDFATTGSGSVTIDVAADCVLDLSGVDVTTEATLVKTGAGTILFGDELPSGLNVQAGVLAVQPYVEYDMTDVTLGQGATVNVAIDGELKPCLETPGQNGTTVYMTGDTYVGVGGWDTLANWVSGGLPDASAVVHVYGSETVLTLDAVPAAMPASIAVEGGATLKTATDVSLPTLTLDKQASLSIDSGITTLANGLVGVAVVDGGNVTLPALSIMDGATLSIPGGMNFSNVDIALYGTLYVSSMGKTTFGYAESGETTYIGFRAEGGKIRLPSGDDYDDRRIGICCPQSGGRVVAVRDIVFKDMPTVGTHFPDWSYPDGFHLGVNNPADETFEVMFDNAKWGVDGNLYVYGGAAFRLRNGSSFMNTEEYGLWNRHAGVKGNGHIIVEGGCELRLNAMGNGGGTPFDVTVDQPGHEAVTVEDGGIFETFRWDGNANGVFSSANGVLRIYNPRYDDNANNWHYVNEPFAKLSAVTLANDSCLTLTTRNGSSSKGFKDASGPRVVALANVPIVGDGGSIMLLNANINAFGVIVRSGANTATGSASVTAVDGTGATTLYFANGANWAGTVVAGNVALTNLTDGAAAATATFCSLDLAADFPIRVWKSEGAYSADAINVGSFIDRGGKLTPVMMSEGEEFAKGDSFVVGKIAKDATLPAVAATGWALKTRPIDGDDAYDEIVLKFGVGLKIIVR